MVSKEVINKSENEAEITEDKIVQNIPNSRVFDKICIQFSVPIFKLDLKNEHNISLIHITLQEFCYYNKDTLQQREVQVLLRSVIMEDLKCPTNSKYRNMVDSSSENDSNNKHSSRNKLSSSCPNLLNLIETKHVNKCISIPTKLNEKTLNNTQNKIEDIKVFRKIDLEINKKAKTENLVIYKSCTTTYYGTENPEETKSSIDFNSLNLIVSIEKWFMVFDFFGLISNFEDESREQQIKKSYNGKYI